MTTNFAMKRSPQRDPWVPPLSDKDLPLQQIYRWEKERANAVFLTQPFKGQVREWTWAQAMDEVRRMAAASAAQDWPHGSKIAILSKNSAWWMMAEFAVWMAGHVSVPIYASLRAQSVHASLEHCEPVACFIGVSGRQADSHRGNTARDRTHQLSQRRRPPELPRGNPSSRRTAPLAGNPVRDADELATIIYTSGTTGAPKGVMHRFAAFSYFAMAVTPVVDDSGDDRMLSYLPLAHIAERALVEGAAIHSGFHIFFVEKLETFLADLRRARPTIFFSVPRLFIKFQHGVLAKLPQKQA